MTNWKQTIFKKAAKAKNKTTEAPHLEFEK